jgi:WD40 repeat protein
MPYSYPMFRSKLAVEMTVACLLVMPFTSAMAQSSFPPANRTFYDVKHKEAKSGVDFDSKTIVIHPGAGTPGTINVLSFSRDGKLLAAGKDFGRIVVWEVSTGKVVCAIESHQKIVSAIAISPDHQVLASSGSEERPVIAIWDLATRKRQRTFDVESRSFRNWPLRKTEDRSS